MTKRKDIQSILIIGAGPIIIGQSCEFDYSGVQACKALREEGYRVILVNSNPATIMTDADMADATYIEPIHCESLRKIIDIERPDAILPTMGGQTALNCALELAKKGILADYHVEMIGANIETIEKAEDRRLFDQAMKKIGLDTARSGIAHTLEEAYIVLDKVGFPCIIRPSFTMGGTGGGIAYNREEFEAICQRGLELSPTHELLIDESLIGWKEYEMEVVRDRNDNCIIVCSIENVDAMGIHTGDSITVAPAQTLTDKEYQIMRNASIAVLREIGVETGGANVQFAINPDNGRLIVIEMNPRVSRSSALASKATGFPIAKVAAKLAIGYTLDELVNDITGGLTPASFEPAIDYVVTKVPRFNFEKFVGCNNRLTTQMKSVGEVMAIGRTFQESLQKALRGLEVGAAGFDPKINNHVDLNTLATLRHELQEAGSDRIWYIADAFRCGFSLSEVADLTHIDRWFLAQIQQLIHNEQQLSQMTLEKLDKDDLRQLKRKGFSDARLAKLLQVDEATIRTKRHEWHLHPVYKRIDTCAGEFATHTAYLYSTYEEECEADPQFLTKKIMILGGGPNRIGQGIEFDYCCVHAALALKEAGFETIMVNCNPETVSTDYDTSHRLYFEPITLEDILEIIYVEKPTGIIVQYGGQTPLKLAKALEAAGAPIIGTSPDAIDCAEDRQRFQEIVHQLQLKQPTNATVTDLDQAMIKAKQIGYPIVVRPSYVLGGRAMEIVYNEHDLHHYFNTAVSESNQAPVLLDHFLDDATEVDMDVLCDGETVIIGGIMEHIEQAGVHSGDSACSLPAYTLTQSIQERLRQQAQQLALALNVKGLMNAQFAIKDNDIYLIEVNPRAARTVPFVSKATGMPLAKIAARIMVGQSLITQKITTEYIPNYYCVKEVVLPFNKFSGVDPILGPEMRSTGEVMGIGKTFAEAFAKAQLASLSTMKHSGKALLSVRENDKKRVVDIAQTLIKHGFVLDATSGTANVLKQAGIDCQIVKKETEGRPNIHDHIKNGEYSYILNTTSGREAINASKVLRRSAVQYNVHYDTTINAAYATVAALAYDPNQQVISLQKLYKNKAYK
jgi:carbamoyl-phosphate synthase large subunit